MSSRGEAFDAFNRTLKGFMRDMAENHPGRFRGLRLLKVAYKALKSLNRRWPRKIFHDTVGAHYAARIRGRDDAFFLRPEFTVPLFEDFVASVKADWHHLDAGARDVVWSHLDRMLDSSDRCGAVAPVGCGGGGGTGEDGDAPLPPLSAALLDSLEHPA